MRTRISKPVKMLIGGLVGFLAIGGWGALALGVLEGIFGGRSNPTWLLLGLVIFSSGSIILGLVNKTQWPRVLLAGFLSPIVAIMFSGGLFALFGILEWKIASLRFDTAPAVVAVYVAVWMGTAQLLTRQSTRAEMVCILRSIGLAFSIVLSLELLSNIVPAFIVGSSSEAGWVTWLVITLYAILIGTNSAYFDAPHLPYENMFSRPATIMCIGLNSAFLVIVVVARLFI